MRTLALAARVGRDDVEAIHIDMPTTHLVARENLNAPDRCHAAQFDLPQARNGCFVKNCALLRGGFETNVVNSVAGGQLKAVGAGGECDNRASSAPRRDCPGPKQTEGAFAKWPLTAIR
jgi:hypothetical protein